ncbi:MAG: carboxypeptidase-like regulatory domain-containing protein, partial [Acidimicrobiales bacterium]
MRCLAVVRVRCGTTWAAEGRKGSQDKAERVGAARVVPLLTLLAVSAATAACSVGGSLSVEPLPDPPSTVATTSTVAPAPLGDVELPSVRGRTTTTVVVVGPGEANLQGTAIGPAGPVPGASIRVERLVGDTVVTADVTSTADGTWSLPGIAGGRYRARAWRPPDLAQLEPAQFFVGARETFPVELKLDRFDGPSASPVLAPSPPVVQQTVSLTVQVSLRSVDPAGIVRAAPIPGARVELSSSTGLWRVATTSSGVTDSSGRARWDVVCGAVGVQSLS